MAIYTDREGVFVLQCESDEQAIRQRLAAFFARMATVERHVLLLDYDGTLAPFHPDPSMALPYPDVPALLQQIQSYARSRVVLVSGRQAKDVARLLGSDTLEIWGCHGLQRITPNGVLQPGQLDVRTMQALTFTLKRLHEAGLAEYLEYKPTGYAVHWRGLAPEQAHPIRQAVEKVWAALPDKGILRMLHFDGGIEICSAARNKGHVVRHIAEELGEPFSMAYLGDDVTDEDAFSAIKEFGGLGVLVKDFDRATLADIRIRPAQGVIAFLESWAKACGSQV
jgi:trehalose 6-phosphate phosphatase